MKAPKIPSFFKIPQTNQFVYKPRYYKKTIQDRDIKFNRNSDRNQQQKAKNKRIIFFIIILSLLSYFILISN